MAKIIMTLSEILQKGNNWEAFCEKYGWSEWAVKEGGGDIEQTLTIKEAKKFGLLEGGEA